MWVAVLVFLTLVVVGLLFAVVGRETRTRRSRPVVHVDGTDDGRQPWEENAAALRRVQPSRTEAAAAANSEDEDAPRRA